MRTRGLVLGVLVSVATSGCIRISREQPYGASLKFTGNNVFSGDALRKIAIDADCHDPITCEVFLEAAYTEAGYVTANLVETEEAGSFTVEEGPRFTYGVIEVVEATPGTAPLVTAAQLTLKTGATVKRSEIKAAIDLIQAKYTAAGFPTANVVPMTDVDLEAKTLGIKIEVSRTGATP